KFACVVFSHTLKESFPIHSVKKKMNILIDGLILWVPLTFIKELGAKTKDRRTGWIGHIRAKLKPEIDTMTPEFQIVCHYD
ncbi:MAG: hypothetical protein SGJ03_12095, partial [Alphaproteobacteria bacterium]|nr:hypothetical protein [Alphaproteobacteria bacterium]